MSQPMTDAEGLRQLVKSGSDLSKLHRVQYSLRFPTEDDAIAAVARLEDLAFAATTERDDANDNWVVLAVKRMYPVESDLRGLREKLEVVASEGHGSYEGWTAKRVE